MATFDLRIIASNKTFFEGKCQSLVLPIADGGMCGFLANHENTVAPIDFGEMKMVKEDGTEVVAFVGTGFFEFFDNTANLVCVSVERPEDIDKVRAEEAKERAMEKLRQKQSLQEYHQTQMDLSRAMERLKVKNRHQI